MEKRVTYDNAIPPSCQYPAGRKGVSRGRGHFGGGLGKLLDPTLT